MYATRDADTADAQTREIEMFREHAGDGRTAVVRELDHTADVAIEVMAASPADLFAGAARAMVGIMAARQPTRRDVEHEVALEESDLEALLVGWLNALLALQDTEDFTPAEFTVSLSPPALLKARVRGERGVPRKLLVKAATFHLLRVELTGEVSKASVVFDV